MNKALPDMIAYADGHGHETFVVTNATKLSPGLIERLIRSGLSRINLCIDGFSKDGAGSLSRRLEFEQVKANIENFLAIKQRLGAAKPLTVLQTLLTSYSEEQVDEMVDWASASASTRSGSRPSASAPTPTTSQQSDYGYLVPNNPELQRHQTETVSLTCDVPLYQTVVFWNGDLGLCCIDYDQVIKLPNVDKVGFVDAYRSDEAARARRNGYTKSFSICQNCSYSNADNMGFKLDLRKRRQSRASGACERRPERAVMRRIAVGGVSFVVVDDKETFWDKVEAGAWEPETICGPRPLLGERHDSRRYRRLGRPHHPDRRGGRLRCPGIRA